MLKTFGSVVATMKTGSTKTSMNKLMSRKGSKGDAGRQAVITELKQIDDKGSWHPIDKTKLSRVDCRKVIRTFMFIIDKFAPDGSYKKSKARLVAMGNLQNPDELGMNTSAPTVDTSAVLTMAAINAAEERHKMSLDIGGAFLHCDWPESMEKVNVMLDKLCTVILIKIRPDYERFINPDGTLTMELDKALYGLVQSAKMWYDRLTSVLIAEGYDKNPVDPCVWNKGSGVHQCTVLFHVDDLSCSCKDLQTLKAFEERLISEFGKENIKCVYGDRHEYLGMLFEYDTQKSVGISMSGYTQVLLDYAGLDGTESAKTPCNTNLFKIYEDAEKLSPEQAKKFHSLVQGVSYMSQRVRWDLVLTVGFLKTRVSCSDEYDWAKLMRMMAYLNATKNLCLNLAVCGKVEVDSSIDASHAVYENGRSQGGLAISLGMGVLKARSHKLSLNTKSSAESELVTTSDNFNEVIWEREFLQGQGYKMGPAVVRQDNQAAIPIAGARAQRFEENEAH